MVIYTDKSGIPLLYYGPAPTEPVLTVSSYGEWYDLYLISPLRGTCEIPFELLQEVHDVTPFIDHVPNPLAFQKLANVNSWHCWQPALEMIAGRWAIQKVKWYGGNALFDLMRVQ